MAAVLAASMVVAACARTGAPGGSGYGYAVDGRYTGRMTVQGEPFDASLELRAGRGGRVQGSFHVRAPLELDGSVDGVVREDLLRLTVRYESDGSADPGRACDGVVEGVLTVSPGGAVLDGPVTITDCGDELAGRMSFRRVADN